MALRAILGAVAVVLLAGCIPFGDPGYAYAVRNDGKSELIVTFGSRADGYRVAPGQTGIAEAELGVFDGIVEVFDRECTRQAVVMPTTQFGVIHVMHDGTAGFEPASSVEQNVLFDGPHLEATDACRGSVQPPPVIAPTEAAFGADAITFVGGPTLQGQLWLVITDGSSPRRLAPAVSGVEEPDLSPDGQYVAYDTFRTGDELDLHVVDVETGKDRKIRADRWNPAWSPDGTHLVAVDGKPADEIGRLLVIDAATASERSLDVSGTAPRWSPDGQWIAYVVPGAGFIGSSHLWVIPAGGGRAREITTATSLANGVAWSPDSGSIATTSGDPRLPAILKIDLNGSFTRLTPATWASAGPSWSPDGRSITFSATPSGDPTGAGGAIYRLDLGGSLPAAVSSPPEFETDAGATWAPDGTRIAFVRGSEEFGDLYVTRSDGTGTFLAAEGVQQFWWRAP
jgi:Tol biopolymer transport system component